MFRLALSRVSKITCQAATSPFAKKGQAMQSSQYGRLEERFHPKAPNNPESPLKYHSSSPNPEVGPPPKFGEDNEVIVLDEFMMFRQLDEAVGTPFPLHTWQEPPAFVEIEHLTHVRDPVFDDRDFEENAEEKMS